MNIIKALIFVLNHPENKNRKLQTLFKLIWWKFNQVFLKYPVILSFNQMKIICYPDSSYGGLILYVNNPEPEETSFIKKYLKKNDVVLDVGANIGAMSLLAHSITKTTVYAFEPTPIAIKRLKENVDLNQLDKSILIIPKAVSDKNGHTFLTVSAATETNRISFKKDNPLLTQKKVETITLDTFCVQNKVHNINLLKIDTEGAELFVFKGMSHLLDKRLVQAIVFEWNNNALQYGYAIQDLIDILETNNLVTYSIHESGKLLPFNINDFDANQTQNLVAALKQNNRIRSLIKK